MLFVLNTGRAGSRTLANVLSQHPELICTHEPLPRLIEETVAFRYGRLAADDLAQALASRPASIDGRRYCESANRLSLAIPVLASTFPDAQFLWLTRDGRDVVSSGMQRGWFDASVAKETPWERHRLRGDELGEVDPEEWNAWSPFRRVSWLWRRTNEIIETDLGAIDESRSMRIGVEELGARMPDVARFLEVVPIDWVVPRMNARSERPDTGPGTINAVERVFSLADWSTAQAGEFEIECGSVMDGLYPGWRTNTDRGDAVSDQTDDISGIRIDLADLRVLRGELGLLSAHALRADRRVASETAERRALSERLQSREDRLAELHTLIRSDREKLQKLNDKKSAVTEALRVADKATKTHLSSLETANGRIVELEGLVSKSDKSSVVLRERVAASEKELLEVRASESFRLGHALVRSVRLPLRVAHGLAWRSRRMRNRLRRVGRKVNPAPAQVPAPKKAGPKNVQEPTPVTLDIEVGYADLDRLDSTVISPGALSRFRLTLPDPETAKQELDDALATLAEDGVGEIVVGADTPVDSVLFVLGCLADSGRSARIESRQRSVVLVVGPGGQLRDRAMAEAAVQTASLVAGLADAQSSVKKLKQSVEQEKKTHAARIEKAHDSTQYRLGAAVLETMHNPLKVVKFPAEVWRLRKRRSGTEPVVPLGAVEIAPSLNLKVVSILDEFTHDCFAPEFDLTPLDRKAWRSQLEGAELVFVESAWRGNGGSWNYTLNKFEKNGDDLRGVLDHAREAGIPSIFWNKEDPVSFDVFLPAAAAFDTVLTTDSDVVSDYKKALGHDQVDALPFAAQPRLHNPIGRGRDVAGRVCFAGSWRGDKYAQRGSDFDILLGPPLERGALDIYDRYASGPDAEKLGFPEPFKSAVVGSLPYSEMGNAYRRYAAFLNVNSVQESPTMFSRRVFELLACGTPVISTPAQGITELLGETVLVTDTRQKTADYVDWVLNEPEERDQFAHLGYRLVHREHSYEQRVDAMIRHAGLSVTRPRRRVSVICVSNRPEMLDHAIKSYERQTYADKELLFVANSAEFDDAMLESIAQRVPGAKVSRVDDAATLGECLNAALKSAEGEYFAKFDDDDHYGDEYLADLMMTFPYSGAAVAGKQSYYAYMSGQDRTVLRFPGKEFRSAPRVVGGTIVADRAQVDGINFEAVQRGTDSRFLGAVIARGLTVFSADRFNFCQVRHADVTSHTWAIEDEDFLKACDDVGSGFRRDAIFL
ncbi:MAG: hypothetical protein ACI8TP_004561 [Acidimicrobiales bacterium]